MKIKVPDKHGYEIVFEHLRQILQLQHNYPVVPVTRDDSLYAIEEKD